MLMPDWARESSSMESSHRKTLPKARSSRWKPLWRKAPRAVLPPAIARQPPWLELRDPWPQQQAGPGVHSQVSKAWSIQTRVRTRETSSHRTICMWTSMAPWMQVRVNLRTSRWTEAQGATLDWVAPWRWTKKMRSESIQVQDETRASLPWGRTHQRFSQSHHVPIDILKINSKECHRSQPPK